MKPFALFALGLPRTKMKPPLPSEGDRYLWLLGVAIAVVLLAGCSSPTNATTRDDRPQTESANKTPAHSDAKVAAPPSFFPTAVGTRWKWRMTTTIGDGKGPFPATVITEDLESKVAGYDEINGTKCARVEVTDSLGTVVQKEYVSVSADGLFRYGMNEDRFQPPIKVLALPAKVGSTWSGKHTIQGITVDISGTIAAQESVTVDAGKFDAVRVEFRPGLLTTITWYAPGIGVVKQSIDKPLLSQRDDLELVEFNSADAPPLTAR